MDAKTAHLLNEATGDFYRRQAASFSATRRSAWPGWERLLAGPAGAVLDSPSALRVLDVGCGNLRFERFLLECAPAADWRFYGVDSCPLLVGDAPAPIEYHEADIVGALLDGGIERELDVPACDLVGCFGFMHHVPGWDNRVRLLRVLAGCVAPGGFLALSFWQFLNSSELADRAAASHARGLAVLAPRGLAAGQLERGDYLLGWQETQDVFRYCHAFDAAEIDALAAEAGLSARIVDRFEADGRTGDLNGYLVIGG
ncbi:MAG: class I SAM-dependent methyltransferase [Coriobacteriaceae bacterium]|nr:class I SAM-dependent methyltransferase [Coriobacteriaceae bacterium]